MFATYLPCYEEKVVLRVEHGSREVCDELLQPPEVLPGAQVVELLLQLVNLTLQVRHLKTKNMLSELNLTLMNLSSRGTNVEWTTLLGSVANQRPVFRSRDYY